MKLPSFQQFSKQMKNSKIASIVDDTCHEDIEEF